jgi:LysM repeat protein
VRGGANLYLVKPGDTLSSIAGRYRVTVEAIALTNGLDDRDFIRAGQSLRLP